MSCASNDLSMTSMEGEKARFSDAPNASPHTDTYCEVGEESEGPVGSEEGVDGWTSPREGAEADPHTNQCWCSQNWESIMEESEGLAYDNPRSSSDATVMETDSPPVPPSSSCDKSGNSPPTTLRGSASHSLGLPMEQMPPLVLAVTTPASGVDTV